MDKIKERYIQSLTRLPGITEEIATALYNAGYTTKQKVFEAKDEDLKKVPGVTTSKLNGLKARRDKAKATSKASHWKK